MKTILTVIFLAMIPVYSFGDVYTDNQLDCCYEILKINNKISIGVDSIKHGQGKTSNQIDSIINLIRAQKDSIVVTHMIKLPKEQKSNDFLGALLGAVLSGLFALGIYKLGEYYDRKKIKIEKNELGEAINVLLTSSVENTSKQLDEYKKYTALVNADSSIPQLMHKIPSHNLKRLRTFDSTLIYRVFKHLGLKKEFYDSFLDNVDYLDDVLESIDLDYHETNTDNVTKLSNEFLKISQEILSDTANHLNEMKMNKQEKEKKYEFLNKLILDYYTIPDDLKLPNIKYDYDNFITPLKKEMITNYRFDSFSISIASKTKRASDLFVSVLQYNKYFSDELGKQLEPIEKAKNNLNKLQKEIEKNYAS